jgi:predicted transcriptional regulator
MLKGQMGDMPTAAQLRAARGILGWSQAELAEKAAVARRTVTTAEAGGSVHLNSIRSMVDAMRQAGVTFTGDDEMVGVAFRRARQVGEDPT